MSKKPKLEMHIRQPAPPSLKAIEKPLVVGNETIIVYCPLAKTGGIYYIDTGMWHTMHPFENLDAFKKFLVQSFPEAVQPVH